VPLSVAAFYLNQAPLPCQSFPPFLARRHRVRNTEIFVSLVTLNHFGGRRRRIASTAHRSNPDKQPSRLTMSLTHPLGMRAVGIRHDPLAMASRIPRIRLRVPRSLLRHWADGLGPEPNHRRLNANQETHNPFNGRPIAVDKRPIAIPNVIDIDDLAVGINRRVRGFIVRSAGLMQQATSADGGAMDLDRRIAASTNARSQQTQSAPTTS
jgi:hypothetical protein